MWELNYFIFLFIIFLKFCYYKKYNNRLNEKRDDYVKKYGPPEAKWWEEKRDNFSDEFAKYKRLEGP